MHLYVHIYKEQLLEISVWIIQNVRFSFKRRISWSWCHFHHNLKLFIPCAQLLSRNQLPANETSFCQARIDFRGTTRCQFVGVPVGSITLRHDFTIARFANYKSQLHRSTLAACRCGMREKALYAATASAFASVRRQRFKNEIDISLLMLCWWNIGVKLITFVGSKSYLSSFINEINSVFRWQNWCALGVH